MSKSRIIQGVLLSGIFAGALYAGPALLPAFGAGATDQKVPDLGMTSQSGWMEVGDELLPPPSLPGPVTNDSRYPYVDNGAARRAGIQPTYRVADLNNPILQPWAKESMKKANDEYWPGRSRSGPARDAIRAAFRASSSTRWSCRSISCRRKKK